MNIKPAVQDISLGIVMSLKRKHTVLSLKEKSEIVEALDRGETGANLARKFGVGTSTIADIKKKREKIVKFYRNWLTKGGHASRKVMRKPKNMKVDDAVHTWFIQQRLSGQPVTGPMLCAKAKDFNKEFEGDPNFKASSGWLENFKIRRGIKQTDMDGDSFSMDVPLEYVSPGMSYDYADEKRSDNVCKHTIDTFCIPINFFRIFRKG